jgi:hypothetical protein
MATYTPASQRIRTDYNFVSAYDLHKPDVNDQMVYPFGQELLTNLLTMVGNKRPTSSLEYSHHESDRIMPKLKATGPGGGAGASVIFTLDSSANLSVAQNNAPYDTSSAATEDVNPARINDTILIKPASGIVSASTYVRAIVTTVSSTTFAATPLDSTDSIPAISSADEIVIYGNAHGEGSNQPVSRSSTTSKYTNNLQIVKDTYTITGSESAVELWTKVKGKDGKSGYVYQLKGEDDTYKQFMNYREMTMLIGEKLNNTTLATSFDNSDTPLKLTEGLIPFILSQGTTQNYSNATGFTLAGFEDMVIEMDKQKAAKDNLFLAGINLSLQIDNELGDRFKDGGFSYGSANFDAAKKVSLKFDTLQVGNYTFQKKTFDAFNDLQTFGASGFGYPNEAMVVPMDKQRDGKTGDYIPSLSYRYLENKSTGESREMKTTPVDLFKQGDSGQDLTQVRYLSECGFEGFGGNRFTYVKQV